MDRDLSDRVYIVADGAEGLGWAAAECLVAEGARVVLSGRDEGILEAAVNSLGQSAAVSVVTEEVDGGAPDRLVAAALATWERVDGALICVAGSPGGRVSDVTDERWTAAFDSTFLSTVRMCRHIAEALPSGGSLVVVLASNIYEPAVESAVENSLQRGLASLVLGLAEELGPRGVRVNGLVPGNIATSRTGDPDAGAENQSPRRSGPIDAIPMRRYGEPREFGQVATFMLSPDSSYITGTVLPIDGGMLRPL